MLFGAGYCAESRVRSNLPRPPLREGRLLFRPFRLQDSPPRLRRVGRGRRASRGLFLHALRFIARGNDGLKGAVIIRAGNPLFM